MDITDTLNETLVKLFRNINTIEERTIKSEKYCNVTVNEMHVMEAIGIEGNKNMTSVAKLLMVTTGTLTIAVNGLVKKEFVNRTRSSKDRRVVLISLTDKGKKVFAQHEQFHKEMVESVLGELTEEERVVLQKALINLNKYFKNKKVVS